MSNPQEDPDPWCEEADGEYVPPATHEDHIEVQTDYVPDRWLVNDAD